MAYVSSISSHPTADSGWWRLCEADDMWANPSGVINKNSGFIYKENKVPFYQRLYQKDDGVRLWYKVRSLKDPK